MDLLQEVEWATERETREAALDRFRAELKPLRKKAKKVEELEARLEGLEGCIPGYDWDDAAGPTSGSAKPVRGSSA